MLNLTQLLSISDSELRMKNSRLRYDSRRPQVIVWNLTESCNLNCRFCYYDANIKQVEAIDYGLAETIVNKIKEARIKYVLLSGGEPILYPKIPALVTKLTANSIRVGISSNGTLVDKMLASVLKRRGLDYIGISLDGLEGVHNSLRNSRRAFARAIAGLKHAKDAGLKTGLRLILNRYNHKQLNDIFSLARGLKVNRLCFYHLVYSGRAKVTDYDLSWQERRMAVEKIVALSAEWIKRKVPAQVLSVDNFSDCLPILEYIQKKAPAKYNSVLRLLRRQGGCPAGKRILSIDHRGIVHPCQFWQTRALADLKKDKLLDALNKDGLFNSWRSRLKGRCAGCEYKDICGGCRVRAYQAYRNFWQEDPSCLLRNNYS